MFTMKKIIGILSLLLIFIVGTVSAAPVSLDTAENVALNWLNERTITRFKDYVVSESFTELERTVPAYYVINLDPEGWVIVAADDAALPIIAYSPDGSYSTENHPPAFDEWMAGVRQAINEAVKSKITPLPEITDEWLRLSVDPVSFRITTRATTKAVSPLVQTAWGQDFPYNEQCPADANSQDGHAVTGCVATAMAQIMKYHAYPQTGYNSHSYNHPTYGVLSADFGSTTYNWSLMPNSPPNVSNTELARLLYHCGVSVEMNYGPFYSGSNMETDAKNALKNYFRYEESIYPVRKVNYSDDQWKITLKTELDALRPMLYAGKSIDGGGHSFICDGYDDAGFFHFNWGWRGDLNGWFNLSDLTPGTPPNELDYSQDQSAVIRIQKPKNPALSFPYNQGFENGLPGEWIFAGERAKINNGQAHSGLQSVLLSDSQFTGFLDFDGGNSNIAAIKINVPSNGAVLSFWVKRGHSAPSGFNKQIAQIRPQFGPDALFEFFNGDFSDQDWQKFSLNLTTWAGNIVTLYFEVDKAYTTPATYQWMYIDDIEIINMQKPVSDFKADSINACKGTINFTDLSSFYPTSWNWSFPGGNPSSSTTQNPSITYNTAGTYTVSLTASNGIGGDTETKTSYITIYDNNPKTACAVQTQNLGTDYHTGIYNFKLGSIDSFSGSAVQDGGYKDFSCSMTTELLSDSDYPVSILVGDWNGECVKVFIDYNNDGDFNDLNESAFASPTAKIGEHTGVIHTPPNPIMDTLLRMRAISDLPSGNSCAYTTQCTSPFYGQAEDYAVVFKSFSPFGDIDDNKAVDLIDAVKVLKIIAGITPTGVISMAADVNQDGKIGMEELIYILQKVAKLRN